MKQLHKVQVGDCIGIFAPSNPVKDYRVDWVERGVQRLRSWGFHVIGADEANVKRWSTLRPAIDRAKEIHALLENKDVDILMAAWGGKHCNDLLDLLDYNLFRKKRKPLIGASDIGVLLNAVAGSSGIPTMYGPNIVGKLHETKQISFPLLMGKQDTNGTSILPRNVEWSIVREGCCTGNLVGGSLGTFVLGLSGTHYFPEFEQTILFWESSSLTTSTMRQHLQHLKLTGGLSRVSGVLVGAVTKVEKDIGEFHTMLKQMFNEVEIPIVHGDFFGHGEYPNWALPVGANLRLDTTLKELILLDSITK